MEQAILNAMIVICSEMKTISDRAKCFGFLASCVTTHENYIVTLEEKQKCFESWSKQVIDNDQTKGK